jgi:hypothetical protein
VGRVVSDGGEAGARVGALEVLEAGAAVGTLEGLEEVGLRVEDSVAAVGGGVVSVEGAAVVVGQVWTHSFEDWERNLSPGGHMHPGLTTVVHANGPPHVAGQAALGLQICLPGHDGGTAVVPGCPGSHGAPVSLSRKRGSGQHSCAPPHDPALQIVFVEGTHVLSSPGNWAICGQHWAVLYVGISHASPSLYWMGSHTSPLPPSARYVFLPQLPIPTISSSGTQQNESSLKPCFHS